MLKYLRSLLSSLKIGRRRHYYTRHPTTVKKTHSKRTHSTVTRRTRTRTRTPSLSRRRTHSRRLRGG